MIIEPKFCLFCSKEFVSKTKKAKFCSQSCAAKYRCVHKDEVEITEELLIKRKDRAEKSRKWRNDHPLTEEQKNIKKQKNRDHYQKLKEENPEYLKERIKRKRKERLAKKEILEPIIKEEKPAKIKRHWNRSTSTSTDKHERYKTVPLICHSCNKEYFVEPWAEKTSKYCSRDCLWNSLKNTTKQKSKKYKECEGCKILYIPKNNSQRFCGHKCSSKYVSSTFMVGENNPNYVKKIEKSCQYCGKLFFRRPLELNQHESSGKFCSRKCKDENQKKEKVKKVCIICNKDYKVFPSQSESVVCSNSCKYKLFARSTSTIETALKEGLEKIGLFPVWQYDIGRWYVIDLAFPEIQLAVEADGDFWHSLPEAIIRDKRKDTYLKNKGWEVLRIKECDIRKNLDHCVNLVKEKIISLSQLLQPLNPG